MIETTFNAYADALRGLLAGTETTHAGESASLQLGLEAFLSSVKACRRNGKKLMWMGNGGSAAIASHEANDFMKNGNCRSMAFHEASALTCISNDYGYQFYFEQMMMRFADHGDVAVFISSSGKSENVVRGAAEAKRRGCLVVTLTGFLPDNPLRKLGDLNFYVPSMEYGYVELCHQILCHAVLDFLYQQDQAASALAAESAREQAVLQP